MSIEMINLLYKFKILYNRYVKQRVIDLTGVQFWTLFFYKMGNRYWITGVQLGMLIALAENKELQDLLGKVLENQYLCEAKELQELKYKEAKKTLNRLRSRS